MRWNNFGIALLDQQQFSDAVQAFNQVVKLRPDYTDGFTNIAIADLGWNKFSLAHDFADKALQLSPGNARSLYYRALIERNQAAVPTAIADLEQAAKQFPNSRDIRRELAISYFLAHKDVLARQEFETAQTIAPDDVLCHYYLAILYRRGGLNAKADLQAKLYSDKREDPEASTTSLAFLLTDPEANRESVPAHVHSAQESSKTTARH
jgi:tetratricopeptide (TPR) repeat protein